METAFTIILLILVLLIYWSNRNNKVNKWFAIAVFICWLGVLKEALLFGVIPYFEAAFVTDTLTQRFMPVYSVMTWALYSFAMPSMVIFSLYFCNADQTRPKQLRWVKALIYIPAILLSVFYPPFTFRFYQLNDRAFGLVYSAYNLCMGVAFTYLLIRGVRFEKSGKAKQQKLYLFWIALVPVIYWLLSAAIPFLLKIDTLDKLWQGNVFILLVCTAAFIVIAFKDGFMGLRLTSETYNWNSDMSIVNKGAEYTSHMLKNQTAKMEWCIDNLNAAYSDGDARPEELAILSRSIATLKNYTDKIKKQSAAVNLDECPNNLRDMLTGALPANNSMIHIEMPDNIALLCDRTHMVEVFANIVANAIEATRDDGAIEITGGYSKDGRYFVLRFTDHGCGIASDKLDSIFTPYFTSKNTERNFGLGLSYCKNIVGKHGGRISAESEPGEGTTIIIELPAKRVFAERQQGEANG